MTVHQFFCILHFCHTCSLCRVELVVQFPARGSTQVLLCLFPGVLWLWHFLYSVRPHPVSSLHICTFVVSRAFMAGAASQAGPAMNARDTTKVHIWRLDTGCGRTLYRKCHSHNTPGKRHNNTWFEPLAGNCTTSSTRQREQVWQKCKIQKNWCTVTVAPTIERHGGHSRTPANQRWDQVPGRSQRLLLG